jgi:hypothetical protein
MRRRAAAAAALWVPLPRAGSVPPKACSISFSAAPGQHARPRASQFLRRSVRQNQPASPTRIAGSGPAFARSCDGNFPAMRGNASPAQMCRRSARQAHEKSFRQQLTARPRHRRALCRQRKRLPIALRADCTCNGRTPQDWPRSISRSTPAVGRRVATTTGWWLIPGCAWRRPDGGIHPVALILAHRRRPRPARRDEGGAGEAEMATSAPEEHDVNVPPRCRRRFRQGKGRK